MSLDIQWYTITVMLMAGAGMGILFDSYRVISDHFKFPKWSLSVMDMLYWITSAFVVFRLLFLSNDGDVRGYVFVGLAIGAIIYATLLSQTYSKLVLLLITVVKRIVQFIFRLIDYIIIKPIIFLYKIVIFCIKFGTKFTIRTIQIMLQLLVPIVKLLFWPLKPLYKPLFKFIHHYWMMWMLPLFKKWGWLIKAKTFVIKWYTAIKKWIYS